jgi:hypothetical protein
MPDLITRHVRSVFCELDTESVVGAPVKAGDESLDHEPRAELHIGKLRDDMREQI